MSSTEMDLAIQEILEHDIEPNYINIVDITKVFVGTKMVGNRCLYARIRDDPNGKTYDIYTCDENNIWKKGDLSRGEGRIADNLDLIINNTDELRDAIKEIKELIKSHIKQRIETKEKKEEEQRKEMQEREKKQTMAERTMRNIMLNGMVW